MKVTISFDTSNIFTTEALEVINAYFNGEINAREASQRLGWSRELWERHMAGIFSNVLSAHPGTTINTEA